MDLDDLELRTRAAGYDDGLLELFAAGVLLLLAAGWLTAPGLVGLLAAVVAIYGWRGVERIRVRVTYPRIGYFRERSDDPRPSARGMLAFIGGSLVLMVVVVWLTGDLGDAAGWRRAAALVSGITLAGGFWYAADRSRRLRHRLVALWSVASGIGLWLADSGATYAGVAYHLVGLALPLAVLGAWTLARFLANHPLPGADAGYGPDGPQPDA
jgi:hypothetical protein